MKKLTHIFLATVMAISPISGVAAFGKNKRGNDVVACTPMDHLPIVGEEYFHVIPNAPDYQGILCRSGYLEDRKSIDGLIVLWPIYGRGANMLRMRPKAHIPYGADYTGNNRDYELYKVRISGSSPKP